MSFEYLLGITVLMFLYMQCLKSFYVCQENSYVISHVNRNDHGKSIICQAATDYTKIFEEEGKSDIFRLNVLCEISLIYKLFSLIFYFNLYNLFCIVHFV